MSKKKKEICFLKAEKLAARSSQLAAALSLNYRHLHYKSTALSQRTFNFDLSSVGVDDGFNVTHAEAESFNVMEIAGVGAVESFEDALDSFFVHADAVVFYANDEVFFCAVG